MTTGTGTQLPQPPREDIIIQEIKVGNMRSTWRWFNDVHLFLSNLVGLAWDVINKAGSSVSDLQDHSHSSLSNLTADDHPQYHTDARGDARYYTQTQSNANYEPKNSNIQVHISSTSNPHSTTAAQVGAAPSSAGVTNGNSHDHDGGDGAQINHTKLSNIGTNTHSDIDTHISGTGSSVHGLGTISTKNVGVTAGPYTTITSITVTDGIVTAISGL